MLAKEKESERTYILITCNTKKDVDQQQGFAVTKWFFDQMITNNVLVKCNV